MSARAAVVGTGLAWLTTRTDLPLRRLLARWLAPLPLVYPDLRRRRRPRSPPSPPAACSTSCSGRWRRPPPRGRGLRRRLVVLTLFTYPYVYLPVAARLGVAAAVARGERPAARAAPVGGVPHRRAAPGVAARSGPAPCSCSSTRSATSAPCPAALPTRSPSRSTRTGSSTGPRSLALGLVLGVVAVAVVGARAGRRPPPAAGRRRPAPGGRCRCRSAAGGGRRSARSPSCSPTPCSARCRCSGSGRSRGCTGGAAARASTDVGDLRRPPLDTAAVGVVAAVVAVAVVLPVAYLTARHRSRARRGGQRRSWSAASPCPAASSPSSLVFWTLSGPGWLGGLYQTLAAAACSPTSSTSAPRRCGPSQVAVGRRAPPARRRRPHARRRPRCRRLRTGRAAAHAARPRRRRRPGAAVDHEGAAGHAAAPPDRVRHPRPRGLAGPGAAPRRAGVGRRWCSSRCRRADLGARDPRVERSAA